MKRHLIVPDTQVKDGVPLEHLAWVAKAINEYKPDVVVHLGDHWDMSSVSTHVERGSLGKEGERISKDLAAGNEAMRILSKTRHKPARKILLRGNHEHRLTRYVDSHPELEGLVGEHLFDDEKYGWEVVRYNNGSPLAIKVDGVYYSHYFANPNTGRAIAGNINNRLNYIGNSFVQGHQQGLILGSKQLATGKTLQGISAGSCLTPDHKVLTADLRYIPLGDVKVGDQLVSFEEEATESKRSRLFKTGTVEAVKRDTAEVFKVTLENGKVFKVTADHLWLARMGTKYVWRRTDALRLKGAGTYGTSIPRLLPEWEFQNNFSAGWLSGLYDGEGCYYTRKKGEQHTAQLALSQNPGIVLSKALDILEALGVGAADLSNSLSRKTKTVRLKGGQPQIAKLLGMLRPSRLLHKFVPEHLGSLTRAQEANVGIVSIEPLGEMEIVRIAIDTKTMIVEGYGHHNCYLHDEPYKGMANAHWRGIVVLNEVEDGSFAEMPLSLSYLCRKYEGTELKQFLKKNYKKQKFSLAGD